MLVLSRRIGETLVINQDDKKIDVTILSITGNQARIGIVAPKEISVHREEIYNKIHRGEPQNKV